MNAPQKPRRSFFLRFFDWLHSLGAHREDRDAYFAMLASLEEVRAGDRQKEWQETLEHARRIFDMDEGTCGLTGIF